MQRIPNRSRPKVVHVCAIDWTVQCILKAQILALKHAGYDVYAMCTPDKYQQALKEGGIEIIPVDIYRSITPLKDLKTLWQFYRHFRKGKFDIVHTHTPKVSLLGQMAAWLARVPVTVHTVHGFYFHDNMKPWRRRFYITMAKIAARWPTVTLSQNPEDVETAINLGISHPQKIRLLGNGIDLSKFTPDRFNSQHKGQKRDEIGVPQNAVVVTIIGRLVKEKGYLELFDAMRGIMANKENVWLVIIGPEEPEKTNRIPVDAFNSYGISERTLYLGSRDDIPELLACSDIYTLPSWHEGFPRSAMEAAAMGLPIVATNIRGCRQVVDDGRNGLLVPFQDSDHLAQALNRMIVDKKLRQTYGKASRKKALEEFDEQRICKLVIDTYKALLNEQYC